MAIRLEPGVVGEVSAANAVVCKGCCYYSSNEISKIYVNGTHLINGTDIFPGYHSQVGFIFKNDSLILPCAVNSHVVPFTTKHPRHLLSFRRSPYLCWDLLHLLSLACSSLDTLRPGTHCHTKPINGPIQLFQE